MANSLLEVLGLRKSGSAKSARVADAKGGTPPGTTAPPPNAPRPDTSGNPDAPTVVSAAPPAGPPASPPASPERATFDTARAGVEALVTVLEAHPQKASIATQIGQAKARLAQADVHAGKAEWPQATQQLVQARDICVAAKKLADDRAAYLKKRAESVNQINAVKGLIDDDDLTGLQNALANADALAKASPPKYANAIAALAAIDTTAKNRVKHFTDIVNANLAVIAAQPAPAQAFRAAQIAQCKQLLADAASASAAGDWSRALMSARYALRIGPPTERMVTRRAVYDAARPAAVAAIDALKAMPRIAVRAAPLDALLVQADTLAGEKMMRFEDGVAILSQITMRSVQSRAADPLVQAYQAERPLANAELAALDKHAAAAKVAAQRESARKFLDLAARAAGAAVGNDPRAVEEFAAGVEAIRRARADLAEGKKIADSLGAATGGEAAAAAKPPDAAAMKLALTAMKADCTAAAASPLAAEAAKELKACTEQLAKTDAALAKNDAKGAAGPLAEAAKALAAARTIITDHERYTADLAALDLRLKAIQALPHAPQIKGRIDAVVQARTEAVAKDKAHAGAEAVAAVRRATDAAAAAEEADRERGRFDTTLASLSTRIAAVPDKKAKKHLDAEVADAKKLADGFHFPGAHAALKRIDIHLDETQLRAAAAANPADTKITTLAASMVAKGGGADVDRLIKDLPNSTDPRTLTALAQGRFGVQFSIDKTASKKRETKAMKALCATYAKIPKDVKSAGSIKKIEHNDSSDSVSGGYGTADASIELTGRPKLAKQEFGDDLTATDLHGKKVQQLPKVDKECQAVGGKADALSFAALHEVGHGVDDAHTFMARNGRGPKFGGWIRYGAAVEQIADAVGPWVQAKIANGNTFYTKPEDKKYVIDKLLNQGGKRPAAAKNSPDAKALDEFDRWYTLATSGSIYERDSDCKSIAIGGRVYHQAYPRDWVSYEYAARSKGLTGYQFRAPGEWFAEIYAGYRANRLGPKHPAREWLKDL